MLFKALLVLLLVLILSQLFRALWLMMRQDPAAAPMSKPLGRRVLLSVVVFFVLLLAMAMGWVSPNPHPN